MRAIGLVSAATSSVLLFSLLAPASAAQAPSRQRAPVVRVYSLDGGVISSYVSPAIEVSENAYVFAVMMDVDGRIQVLHPEFPGISVRILSHRQLSLPNFFAGYNAPMESGARYTRNGLVSDDRYQALGNDTRGIVIALASRAPFNLDLIAAGGDWNISEIRRLIENRNPAAAAQSLARYLGARGEPIGQDFMRFAGQRQNGGYYAYDDSGYSGYSDSGYSGYSGYCGYGYGALGGGSYPAQAFTRAAALRSLGYRPVVVGYDACGLPVIGVASINRSRFQSRRRNPGDTTVFPKSRMPVGFPHHPMGGDPTPRPVPEGIFPLPQRAEPRVRGGTMQAPYERRAEPREMPNEFRTVPVMPAYPERAYTPVQQTAPARAEPAAAAIGAFPAARPEPPRVIIQRSPPPPPPKEEPPPRHQR